jgi:hypothetical protein
MTSCGVARQGGRVGWEEVGTNRNGDGMVEDAGRRMVGVQKLILEYKLKMYYYYLFSYSSPSTPFRLYGD